MRCGYLAQVLGLTTTRTSCIRAGRASSAAAITVVVALQACSVLAAPVARLTAAVLSVCAWHLVNTPTLAEHVQNVEQKYSTGGLRQCLIISEMLVKAL